MRICSVIFQVSDFVFAKRAGCVQKCKTCNCASKLELKITKFLAIAKCPLKKLERPKIALIALAEQKKGITNARQHKTESKWFKRTIARVAGQFLMKRFLKKTFPEKDKPSLVNRLQCNVMMNVRKPPYCKPYSKLHFKDKVFAFLVVFGGNYRGLFTIKSDVFWK